MWESFRTSSASIRPGTELESMGKVKQDVFVNSSRKEVIRECVKPPNEVVSFMT